jgi:lysophospholipase L1-like esterase
VIVRWLTLLVGVVLAAGAASAVALSRPAATMPAVVVPGPQPAPSPLPAPAPPGVPPSPHPAPLPRDARFLLALGDSAAVWNDTHSYPYLIAAHLRRRIHHLTVEDLAISGETSSTMLTDGQYGAARRFLRAHWRRVALITIDIGGNDIAPCVLQGSVGPSNPCGLHARAEIRRNVTKMLRGLRAAAHGAPIYGMTYYDPFLGDWLAGGVPRERALATLPGLRRLNRELVSLYGARRTADVEDTFRSFDFASRVASPWGRVPPAVARACAWLDIRCHEGAAEGFGDDPDLAGAGAIARAFERVIDRRGGLRDGPSSSG